MSLTVLRCDRCLMTVLLPTSDIPRSLTPKVLRALQMFVNCVQNHLKAALGSQVMRREFSWLLLRTICSVDGLLPGLVGMAFYLLWTLFTQKKPAPKAYVLMSGLYQRLMILIAPVSGESCAGVVQRFQGCKGQFGGWICNFKWGFSAWVL